MEPDSDNQESAPRPGCFAAWLTQLWSLGGRQTGGNAPSDAPVSESPGNGDVPEAGAGAAAGGAASDDIPEAAAPVSESPGNEDVPEAGAGAAAGGAASDDIPEAGFVGGATCASVLAELLRTLDNVSRDMESHEERSAQHRLDPNTAGETAKQDALKLLDCCDVLLRACDTSGARLQAVRTAKQGGASFGHLLAKGAWMETESDRHNRWRAEINGPPPGVAGSRLRDNHLSPYMQAPLRFQHLWTALEARVQTLFRQDGWAAAFDGGQGDGAFADSRWLSLVGWGGNMVNPGIDEQMKRLAETFVEDVVRPLLLLLQGSGVTAVSLSASYAAINQLRDEGHSAAKRQAFASKAWATVAARANTDSLIQLCHKDPLQPYAAWRLESWFQRLVCELARELLGADTRMAVLLNFTAIAATRGSSFITLVRSHNSTLSGLLVTDKHRALVVSFHLVTRAGPPAPDYPRWIIGKRRMPWGVWHTEEEALVIKSIVRNPANTGVNQREIRDSMRVLVASCFDTTGITFVGSPDQPQHRDTTIQSLADQFATATPAIKTAMRARITLATDGHVKNFVALQIGEPDDQDDAAGAEAETGPAVSSMPGLVRSSATHGLTSQSSQSALASSQILFSAIAGSAPEAVRMGLQQDWLANGGTAPGLSIAQKTWSTSHKNVHTGYRVKVTAHLGGVKTHVVGKQSPSEQGARDLFWARCSQEWSIVNSGGTSDWQPANTATFKDVMRLITKVPAGAAPLGGPAAAGGGAWMVT